MNFDWIREINEKGSRWIRTCQECGHKQEDVEPKYGVDLPQSYEMRKCKKCKSESLDYGSRVYNVSEDY